MIEGPRLHPVGHGVKIEVPTVEETEVLSDQITDLKDKTKQMSVSPVGDPFLLLGPPPQPEELVLLVPLPLNPMDQGLHRAPLAPPSDPLIPVLNPAKKKDLKVGPELIKSLPLRNRHKVLWLKRSLGFSRSSLAVREDSMAWTKL